MTLAILAIASKGESMDRRNKKIEIRVNTKEDNRIQELAERRGISKSQYVRTRALTEEKSIYDKNIEKAIMNLCSICEEFKEDASIEVKTEIERSVSELWQFLK